MDKIPAKTGWLWVKEGFALFRKQPAELSTLFFGYMFLMMLLGIIPVIGQLMPLILVPLFSMTFMHACVYIETGKKVYPNLLLVGFRSPFVRNLIKLGTLYLLAAIIAIPTSIVVSLMGTVFDPAKNSLTYPVYVFRRSIPLNGIRSANCQNYTHKTESNYAKLADARSKATVLYSKSYAVNLSGDFESRRLVFNSKYKRDQFLSYLRDYAPRCRITRWS